MKLGKSIKVVIKKTWNKIIENKIMTIFFIVTYLIGNLLSNYFVVDKDLIRDILNIIAFGCIAMFTIHPLIFFQIINRCEVISKYETISENEKLLKSFDSLKIEIFSLFGKTIIVNIALLVFVLLQISLTNIISDSMLFFSALLTVGNYVGFLTEALLSTINVLKDLFIKFKDE